MYNNRIDTALANLDNTEKEIKMLETRIASHQQMLGSNLLSTLDEQMRAKIKVYEDRLNNVCMN